MAPAGSRKKVWTPEEIRLREDVSSDIHKRIQKLGTEGRVFEEGARCVCVCVCYALFFVLHPIAY